MTSYQEVSLNEFEKADRAFYRETTRFFESEQFSHLGDVEDIAETREHPSRRTCIRMLAASDGSALAAIYHVPLSGILGIVKLVIPLKFVELETELSDGEFLATTNNGLGESNPHIDKSVDIQATPGQLLERHRERVRDYLVDHPGTRIRPLSSLREAVEAQRRKQLLKARPAPERARRKARPRRKVRPQRRSPGMLQAVDRRRAAIASVLAIVLTALAASFLVELSATGERDPAPGLTPEQLEQAFEEHRERESRYPPSASWWLTLTLPAVAVFFLTYEALRRASRAALDKLVGRGRGESRETRHAGGRHSARPETIGKIVFAAGICLMLATYAASRSTERLEAARELTLEDYRVDVESRREGADSRAGEPASHFWVGVVIFAATLGVYELAGTIAATAAALAAGGAISRGAHRVLRVFGTPVCVLGTLMVFAWVGRDWPGETPWWLAPPGMFIGVLAVLFVLGQIFDKIPVPCSKCGDNAYRRESRDAARHRSSRHAATVWECRECGHVQ